ncbi:MAG TPA: molybdopterin converting factor subunit 1 [Bacilli bacterium]
MIRVLLFAALAEAANAARVALPLENGVTIGHVRAALADLHPEIADKLACCIAAVNQTYCPDETIVTAADEIAFIPPVSGG